MQLEHNCRIIIPKLMEKVLLRQAGDGGLDLKWGIWLLHIPIPPFSYKKIAEWGRREKCSWDWNLNWSMQAVGGFSGKVLKSEDKWFQKKE